MTISPDHITFLQWGSFSLNATLAYTWVVMAILVLGSWIITRNMSSGIPVSRWQSFLETLVSTLNSQIRKTIGENPGRYLPFLGTLFLFIALSNVLSVIPGYEPPTGSLSTTTALAVCVFLATPLFGISRQGFVKYLKRYIDPSIFMLPFNVIGEFSRTLALAVRLYGNIMAGSMILAILLIITPFFVPIVIRAFGLLIGFIQAYIFSVLAMVYIASATRTHEDKIENAESPEKGERKNG
jgi:F-type H+-transporting ATPase subunit a